MQEFTIRTVSEYVDCLAMINRGTRGLYRGQRSDRSLLPKIARLTTYLPILQAEREMIEVFKLRSEPLLEQRPVDEWDWLAIMQHHGLATRLLDWSLNPLAALWFCVCKPAAGNGPGVVWLFHPASHDYVERLGQAAPTHIHKVYVLRSRSIAARIRSQSGWFTAHYFDQAQERFIALEADSLFAPRLTKLLIPSDAFANLRFQLDRLEVNAATLFPDLDGLCANIEWAFSSFADEAVQDIPKKSFPIPDLPAF
jgi:hypothetical protein